MPFDVPTCYSYYFLTLVLFPKNVMRQISTSVEIRRQLNF
jgi:hypothetical protein